MRTILITLFAFLIAICNATPNLFADFVQPLLEESETISNETLKAEGLELVKRQSGCASGYNACSNLGAPGLCCKSNSVCSADAAGHVACCPTNAACTGTIGGSGATVTASATTTSTVAFVTATTTTSTGAFIIGSSTASAQSSGASYVRSTVSNTFYPFAYIPTTYTNAAACSSAYTSCQTDASSCTQALANGVQGVTVSAPNGGATVTAIASVGSQSASSICQSLSSQACYGLQVEACASFGSGNSGSGGRRMCGDLYKIGAGVAIGMAGELLR